MQFAKRPFNALCLKKYWLDIEDFILVYLDDIIVYSKITEEHIHHVGHILERRALHGVVLKLSKSLFAKQTITFLVVIIGNDFNRGNAEQLKVISETTVPNTKKQLQMPLLLRVAPRVFISRC